MRKTKIFPVVALGLSWLAASAPAFAADALDLLVIANTSLSEEAVTKAELHRIFLKQRSSWRSGRSIVPLHQLSGSSGRVAFLLLVLGMSESEEKRYWEEQKVRRGITAPTTFTNVSKAVFKLAGGISYVFRRDYREGTAKVLLVIPAASALQTLAK